MIFSKKLNFICDFDSTITKQDTIKTFFHYYTGDKWLVAEKKWEIGEIGSMQCVEEQVLLLPNLSYKQIDEFLLKNIQIDETFLEFYSFIKKNEHYLTIVSDGFDYFITKILEKHGILDVPCFSNKFCCENDVISIKFPYTSTSCLRKMGTCKCQVADKIKKEDCTSVYIGDGLSDCCVSNNIDFVFAKDSLLEHCRTKRGKNFCEFRDFRDILKSISDK